MTLCARSHTIPGSHTPPCTCTRECPDHDDHCKGCAPAEATRGLLCGRCSQRLRDLLGASEGLDPDNPVHGLAWAWDHLSNAFPSLTQAPGRGGSSIDDPEAERLAAVISVRGDTHFLLQLWTLKIMNAHSLTGPDFPHGERIDVRRFAAWLLVHAAALEQHPDIGAGVTELGDLLTRAHALAPWRDPPTHIKGIPCRCGETALHDHTDEVKCWKCGYIMTRAQYRVLTVVYGRRFADDPRALRERGRGRLESSRAGSGGRP